MVDNADTASEQQTLSLQQALDLAVKHHTAGDLLRAESIYNQILVSEPDQPQALHLLGVIAHQGGHNDAGFELIGKALAIKPDYAEAHNNLGNAFKALGKLDEAMSSYESAIKFKTRFAEAYINLASTLMEVGRADEAIKNFQQALILLRHGSYRTAM